MTANNLHNTKLHNDRAASVRQAATATPQRGSVTTDTVRRGVEATVEMTHQGAQTDMEATRRAREMANETVRRSTQMVAEGQRQIAQEAAQTFQEVSRKVTQGAQGASEEVRRLATLPHAAQGGLRDLQEAMTGLIEGIVHTNLRATHELFRLANPAAIIGLQQRFMRDYLDTVMQSTATLVRAVRRTADETLHPLEAQLVQRQQAHQSDRTGG